MEISLIIKMLFGGIFIFIGEYFLLETNFPLKSVLMIFFSLVGFVIIRMAMEDYLEESRKKAIKECLEETRKIFNK